MNTIKKFRLDMAFYFAELLNRPLVMPHHVYMDLTHNCTHKCIMCGVIQILKGKTLPFDDIRKIIDEIKGWEKENTILTLTGGEPLTRKDIFDIIEYATSNGIRTELITNGYLIDEDKAKKLIASGLENISVSIEGSTAETHDSITGINGSFAKATNAVKMLADEKKKNGSGPQISVWMTIMSQNIGEIHSLAKLSKSLGVDCLVYHPVIVNPADMQNTTTKSSLWPDSNKIKLLREEIKKIVDFKRKHGMIAFLHDPMLFTAYFEGSLVRREWKCNPFEFLSIGPDGKLQVCGDSFGSISNSSIAAEIKNEKASDVRQKMKLCSKNCLQTCWARPDADSIKKIVSKLITSTDKLQDKEKKQVLEEALSAISEYREMLKWEH